MVFQSFLTQEELSDISGDIHTVSDPEPATEKKDGSAPTRQYGVTLTHVCARWDPLSKEDTLKDVSVEVESGQLCAIVGPVGSGKVRHTLNILCTACSITNWTPPKHSIYMVQSS